MTLKRPQNFSKMSSVGFSEEFIAVFQLNMSQIGHENDKKYHIFQTIFQVFMQFLSTFRQPPGIGKFKIVNKGKLLIQDTFPRNTLQLSKCKIGTKNDKNNQIFPIF